VISLGYKACAVEINDAENVSLAAKEIGERRAKSALTRKSHVCFRLCSSVRPVESRWGCGQGGKKGLERVVMYCILGNGGLLEDDYVIVKVTGYDGVERDGGSARFLRISGLES
jgi:hypothetical protein